MEENGYGDWWGKQDNQLRTAGGGGVSAVMRPRCAKMYDDGGDGANGRRFLQSL